MELELSLSPPNQKRQPIRKSCHGFDRECSSSNVTRFPLVSWNHDEDDHETNNTFFNDEYQQNIDGNRERVDGWPPLHSWRKRFIEGVEFNGRVEDEQGHENINVNNNELLFVKVKMDGVGIARKIDLNLFHSYKMLTDTLIHMFDKYIVIEEDGASYELMYQHKDRHWLLAGDLPWEIFTHTVKRIHMVRNNGRGL